MNLYEFEKPLPTNMRMGIDPSAFAGRMYGTNNYTLLVTLNDLATKTIYDQYIRNSKFEKV